MTNTNPRSDSVVDASTGATKNKSYESAKINKTGKSQIEITATVSTEVFGSYRTKALQDINNSITIDGFRKGMVPENILVAKVGEMVILEEMAEMAISKAYIDIIIDNKLDAIGRPTTKITKLAAGNPLEFSITTAVMPEIKLPDCKTIADKELAKSSADEEKVTDKDIEDAILHIRKSHASHEGHDHDKMSPEEHEKAIMTSLPELTDDFVKKLGDFNDIPDFKDKLSVMLSRQKRDEAKDKLRIRIADSIAEATKVELPDIMVDSELHRTETQFSADLERMGVKMEDYLKHAKKTQEDIRKEWRPHAEKKAKLQLILNAISVKENIKPETKEIEEEVNHILEHYKDADRENAYTYAETVLTNEKVFQWLERK
jgi:FKBP-type peptidyl-prolyl cis-trans isomerase (trigger factor)